MLCSVGLYSIVKAGIAPTLVPTALAKIPTLAVYRAPLLKKVVATDFDPNPQYTFSYDVQDQLTGDSKSQIESRNGDVVQGSYSLLEPDGTRRIVEYVADPVNGFSAVVRREPSAGKPVAYTAVPTPKPLEHKRTSKHVGSPKIPTPLAFKTHFKSGYNIIH